MSVYRCADCDGLIDPESVERFKGGLMGRCVLCRHFGPATEPPEPPSTSEITTDQADRKADYLRDREI